MTEQYAKMIQNVYKQKFESVHNHTLKAHSKNVFYYENEKTKHCVFAIRGMIPTNAEDITAVSSLISNGLSHTTRYKRDLDFIKGYNYGDQSKTIFVGHSLGGAICDQLINDGIAHKCITFNPAVQPKDIRNNHNERYYNPNDFLYLLIGRYTSHHHVVGTDWPLPIPLKALFSVWTFHRIQNFLPDYEPMESYEENKDYTIQAIHLKKTHFNSIADATAWIRRHKYKYIHVDQTPNEYRFRLLDPEIIKTNHYQVKEVQMGDIGYLVSLYK